MLKIEDVTRFLESEAPLVLQEDYDNSGLILGDRQWELKGILITLDATEEIIEEAIQKGCNLVIAHHPIIFNRLKRLSGENYVEKAVICAIKNDIAVYAIHTNLDNLLSGVNKEIADRLEIREAKILLPRVGMYNKLVTFCPPGSTREVLNALHRAGSGVIGNYDHCSFRSTGTGSFKPNELANPHIGKKNELEETPEDRIEVQFPAFLVKKMIEALKETHPYEEPAYYIHPAEVTSSEYGAGIIGHMEQGMNIHEFLSHVKNKLELQMIRHTMVDQKKEIKRVAVCGGAGSFLLKQAIQAHADAFISSDFKYHEFFDAGPDFLVADIGHYEGEKFTKDLLYRILNKKFSNIALQKSDIITNPIRYYS